MSDSDETLDDQEEDFNSQNSSPSILTGTCVTNVKTTLRYAAWLCISFTNRISFCIKNLTYNLYKKT